MTVRLDGHTILLEDDCHIEDVEALLSLLQGGAGHAVDISALRSIHTAALQLLLAFRPKIMGPSQDGFIQRWIAPLLAAVENE